MSSDQYEKLYDETKQGVKLNPALTSNESDDEDNINDDGKFWMSWSDFLDEFESLTICHLDNDNEIELRAKGTFRLGLKIIDNFVKVDTVSFNFAP